jgi:hypothetical protein
MRPAPIPRPVRAHLERDADAVIMTLDIVRTTPKS